MRAIHRAARITHVLIVTITILAVIGLVLSAVVSPIGVVAFAFEDDRGFGFYWLIATLTLGALAFAGSIYLLLAAALSD